MGNKELYIEAGSTINLTCIIQAGAMRDTHIFWNYDGKVRGNALFQTTNPPKKIRILNSGELHKSFIRLAMSFSLKYSIEDIFLLKNREKSDIQNFSFSISK